MTLKDHIWSIVIVTATTVLIWAVVASATRSQSTLYEVTIKFVGTGAGRWDFEPRQTEVDIKIEGSTLAIQAAEKAVRGGSLLLEIPTKESKTPVNLLERLREFETLTRTGVSVVAVEPDSLEVLVDELREYDAVVAAPNELPGIQPEGKPTVSPATARVLLSTQVRELHPTELVVEPIVDPVQLQGREPGVNQTVRARLRLRQRDPLGPPESAPVIPEMADVSFIIASRIREILLDNVRVHVAGPHEDFNEYSIAMENESLRNVTISADSDLTDLVESGAAKVVALVHLTHRDKEQAITEKAVTCFLLLRDDADLTRGIPVDGRVEGADNPVRIGLTIEPRGE